ncbi:MAG: hypothetical protein ACJ8C4_10640 [Gemmataceae bacterium]
MKSIHNQKCENWFDDGEGVVFEDFSFDTCFFDHCGLSLGTKCELRSTLRHVIVRNCTVGHVSVGPAIFEDVLVDGLETHAMLILFGPLFKHVTLRGQIGEVKINESVHHSDRSPETQRPFDLAKAEYYRKVDWALDIREAEFRYFSSRGIPSQLIRRDSMSQVVVKREKAMSPQWKRRLSPNNKHWPIVIDICLESTNDPEFILVAEKRKGKRHFQHQIDCLNELRDLGVAEPN